MYFSKFPLVDYIFEDRNRVLRSKLATNILRKVGFSSLSKKDKGEFITYRVKDSETPEIIADKLYDDPEYHWIVLLFNDIIHPYFDWPMGNLELDEYIEKKYSGFSLYLTDTTPSEPELLGNVSFYENQTVVHTTGSEDNYGVLMMVEGGAKGLVKKWDSTYSRLDVEGASDWSKSDYIVGIGATGQQVLGKIQRVVPSEVALHHFERQQGGITGERIRLNPLATVETDGQIPLGATGFTFGADGAKSGLHDVDTVKLRETLIGRYMGLCGSQNNDNVITNRDYETRINDDKREIKLLHPDYVDMAVQELQSLMKVKGLIT